MRFPVAVLPLALVAAAAACPDECSLNGVCENGECKCDVPWSGASCGILQTAPAQLGGIYGFAPNISSWGGSLVTDAAGLHHLFAAEIPGGLRQWASHSQCIHATSQTLTGPFTRKDTALKPWCHGPQVVQDPISKQYVMVHVGTGSLTPPPPPPPPPRPPPGPPTPEAQCLKTNSCPPAKDGPCPTPPMPGWTCYPGVCGANKDPTMQHCGADLAEPRIQCGGTQAGLAACALAAAKECDKTAGCGAFSLAKVWTLDHAKLYSRNATHVPVDGWATWLRVGVGEAEDEEGGGSTPKEAAAAPPAAGAEFMHHSLSLNGPWIASASSPGGCGMPTAAFHPNGTLFVVCGNGHAITRATSAPSVPVWQATWSPQVRLHPEGEQGNWEDPDLWWDSRGNFHILYHVFSMDHDYHIERCSGHAWSRDGWGWNYSSTVQPFNCTVDFIDGSSRAFATRERPHLIFVDKARTTPVAVISAVSSQPVGPACASCNAGACSQCKVTAGRDWTYTIMQPFVNFPKDGLV